MMEEIIRFYNPTGKYWFLSNFAEIGFELDGYHWSSVEHYYQAQKYIGTKLANVIRRSANPMEAKLLGRENKLKRRDDWSSVKEEIMLKALIAKFEQNTESRNLLISTDSVILVEQSETDLFWGAGKDGRGLNRHGQLLMKVRHMLQTTA